MRPEFPLFRVDAFTGSGLAGNPAAVALLEAAPPADWMQRLAAELALPETAFLWPAADGAYELRWFTPTEEVALCGHATLASAAVLWNQKLIEGEARFHSKSGLLLAAPENGRVRLDFPSLPETEIPAPQELTEAGIPEPVHVGRASNGNTLVEVRSEAELRRLRPRMEPLRGFPNGLMLTARSEHPRYHFVSRFFSPNENPPEDPVTGSAHCTLGPYWGEKLGLDALQALQASARGGELEVRLRGTRVQLIGSAQIGSSGRLPGPMSPA